MLKFSGSSYACQVWLERGGCLGSHCPPRLGAVYNCRTTLMQGHKRTRLCWRTYQSGVSLRWRLPAAVTRQRPSSHGGVARPKAHSTATHNQVVGGVSQTLTRACSKWSAMCVQRFDDSLSSAFRITYRISLRSSSS